MTDVFTFAAIIKFNYSVEEVIRLRDMAKPLREAGWEQYYKKRGDRRLLDDIKWEDEWDG